ncbi:MAG: hypothetical protein ACYTFG_10375 [Planctomycetota bacterium]|jgi:hypothetical protein
MEVSAHKSHSKKKPDLSKAARKNPEKMVAKGLCVNCTHLESCTFPGSGTGSLTHCEEFHCESGECAPASAPKTNIAADSGVSEPQGLKGLCVNCDERFGCSYQKPPEGVWHCAEYQ